MTSSHFFFMILLQTYPDTNAHIASDGYVAHYTMKKIIRIHADLTLTFSPSFALKLGVRLEISWEGESGEGGWFSQAYLWNPK